MPRGVDELEDLVRKYVIPSHSDELRARRALTELLGDGEVHGIREIQRVLIVADAVPEPAHGEKIEVASSDNVEAVVSADNIAIARKRLALAASNSLLDLIALGTVVPASGAPGAHTNPEVKSGTFTIGYQLAGYGSGVKINSKLPEFASAYRLTPRLASASNDWFSDPDLFVTGLDALQLPVATRRCVTEALESFRKGLFLSAVSMLGAASEGAWYAAGEQLRHLDDRLAKALDGDNTVRVVSRVAEVLRQDRRFRAGVDELVAQAALLRQLRNYGVHPRDDLDSDLDRYLTDSGSGLLLMETYAYFSRLSAAVKGRLEPAPTESAQGRRADE